VLPGAPWFWFAEDWEHEEDRQDDDEAVQADAEDAQQQQKMEAQALEEEGEAEGVDMEELQQVWKEAQGAERRPREREHTTNSLLHCTVQHSRDTPRVLGIPLLAGGLLRSRRF